MLSHSMETYFGAPHDNNLSDLIAEANMRCIIDNARKMIATPEKFARFATEVWGIDALEAFIAEIGLPGTLSEMGISGEGADEMLRAVADSTIIIPTCPKMLDADEVFEILEAVK